MYLIRENFDIQNWINNTEVKSHSEYVGLLTLNLFNRGCSYQRQIEKFWSRLLNKLFLNILCDVFFSIKAFITYKRTWLVIFGEVALVEKEKPIEPSGITKKDEGMKYWSLRAFNDALQAKHAWRIIDNADSIAIKV